MRYLVTGGSGFIGSHIVDKLVENGHEVSVLDLWESEEIRRHVEAGKVLFNKGSVLEEDLKTMMKDVDVVIHLASILGTSETIDVYDVEDVATINIIGTLKIFKSALKNDVKKVLLPTTPDAPWLNPYKITKHAVERFSELYYKEFGLNVIALKLGNIYGSRERWLGCGFGANYNYQKVIPTFIMKALLKEPLPVFGDGKQRSEYIHISDAVRAFMVAIDCDSAIGKVIPIGIGVQSSPNEIIETLEDIWGLELEREYLPMRRGEVKVDLSLDISLAEEVMEFKAKMGLKEGLLETIPYYQKMSKRSKN